MASAPDISTRLAAMPDEEVMRLHASMRLVRQQRAVDFLRSLPHDERKAAFHSLDIDADMKQKIRVMWEEVWARPAQLPPVGEWQTWLALAGRGWGKTEAGAQWVRQRVRDGARKIAIIAETQKDLEEVMIARLMTIHPPEEQPSVRYKPVRMVWPNGAMALGYNGTEPDQLRGPEFDTAWVDELAKYACARETWDMLQFTMRSGEDPRVFVTTTPRPIPIIREIIASPSSVGTGGTTMENAANLAPKFLEEILAKYEGTRLGRQELNAEVLDDVPGALWTREVIDAKRVDDAPEMQRIVIAVDPSGTRGEADEEANDIGIVVVGLDVDGQGYVIADLTCNLSPEGWARRVIGAYNDYQADRVVAETNFGGGMVGAILRAVDPDIPFSEVRASRGKIQRAEPVAALYEQGRVSHVGVLSKLEDQMMLMTGAGYMGEGSPDRVDAAVWGLTDIMLQSTPVYKTAIPEFSVKPFAIPEAWPRAYVIFVEPEITSVLWGAYDKAQDVLFITAEHVRRNAEAGINAQAIAARGKWVPGIIESDETRLDARQQMAAVYWAYELQVVLADRAVGAGIAEAAQRISSGRLRVFETCQRFFREYRSHRRDEEGNVMGKGLMDCLRILSRPSTILAMKPKPRMIQPAVFGYGKPGPAHRGDRRAGY